MQQQQIQQQQVKNLARGIGVLCDWYVDRAENATIWSTTGKTYTDFAGGIAVLNTGHRHPKVIEAVKAQLDRFTHTSFQVSPYASYVELLERLIALAPIQGPAKGALFTTGAEAVENAVKIARAATGRHGIITFSGAFHGRSFMTMAMTGKVLPYKRDFGAMPAGVFHAKYPNALYGISIDAAMNSIDDILTTDIAPESVAAIVVEPVQGEGGFHVAPPEFFRRLRALCDQHGILLIADEVQTGFARTGQVFAMDYHPEVKVDLMTMAKSLGGGFPISAVIGRQEIMDAPHPGGLGGTYAGNPLAVAAAHAVLDVIHEEKLCERANKLGAQLIENLEELKERHTFIQDIRGLGSMVAVELQHAEQVVQIQRYAMEHGLLLLSCGKHGNVIRFLYPLTIPDEQFKAALSVLNDSFAQVKSSTAA
ncbi:4-aminobutyrate--2-oxoglutarate transaminase [uncultured Acinetobacter sp.]|uniref:4-aminobutyrate--2-oxoglutarate transaminase n=1 Tax=uncultured Acinetobacter sp. TaxID=165433 RepID=UPI00261F2037|nr:4-aminobutyrate--2-oxoglutarate transaminase [uncultured Acinetobacter sp.]